MSDSEENDAAGGEEEDQDPSEDEFKSALIEEVEKYPQVYVKSSRSHKDKISRQNGWLGIARTLKDYVSLTFSEEDTAVFCEKKWMSLRNAFNRSQKKKPSGSGAEKQYKFARQMVFLKPHLQNRSTLSNLNPSRKTKQLSTPLAIPEATPDRDGNLTCGDYLAPATPQTPQSSTTSATSSAKNWRGKDNILEELLKEQSKGNEKIIQALSLDVEKLDDVDHTVRAWALKIKKFNGKKKRDLVRAMNNFIEVAEDEMLANESDN